MIKQLSKVVDVDTDKCVNCHACITACPVKFCNDGHGDHIVINDDLCIGCGSCITACTHEARLPVDDFETFKTDISKGEKVVAVVAPAIAANFPERYLQFNGWLKAIGVDAIFDVSFGAELTVKSYLKHIKANNPETVIAQPCPAIVSYVEIYKPELIKYLAPADSPMVHTIKMVKEYYKKYSSHKVLVVSPCIAKKREFEATSSAEYNVTMSSFNEYFGRAGIKLSKYAETDYDNPPAERAVLFSTPGGLLRTAEREVPGIGESTRKIEGKEHIYEYLDHLPESIRKGTVPLLIDCLNCEKGCNGGPGTMNKEKSADEIESLVEKRKEKMISSYDSGNKLKKKLGNVRLHSAINKYWKKDLYNRTYSDLSANNTISYPNKKQLDTINEDMLKYSNEDFYNCSACGYGNCDDMAIAIHNGLNTKDNCHHYKTKVLNSLLQKVGTAVDEYKHHNNAINSLIANLQKLHMDFMTIDESFTQYSSILNEFSDIAETLNKISAKTNILSLYASVEAAKAGDLGSGFAVVATEVQKLAANSNEQSDKIKPYSDKIQSFFNEINEKLSVATEEFGESTMITASVKESMTKMFEVTSELNGNGRIE